MKQLLTLMSACFIFSLMVLSVRGSGRPDDDMKNHVKELIGRYKQGDREAYDLLIVNIDEKLFPVYLEALKDADAKVRRLAIRQLARYKKKEAIAPIGQLLESDASEGVRREAASRLGHLTYPESSRLLIDALDDDSQRVVEAVIRALGRLKSKEAIESLKEKLKGDNEKDWEIQRAAAYALRVITGMDWSEGIHEVPPEYRTRDEEFTFEAYERAIRYFSRSVPAMIDTTIIIDELIHSEMFYIGGPNRFTILQGFHLKQNGQLQEKNLNQALLAQKLGTMTDDDVTKANAAYDQAQKKYKDFLGKSGWAD